MIGRPLSADPGTSGSGPPVSQGSPVQTNVVSDCLLESQRKALIYWCMVSASLIVLSTGVAGTRTNPLFYLLGCFCGYFGIRRLITPLLMWYAVSLGALVAVEIFFAYFFVQVKRSFGLMTVHVVIATVAVAALHELLRLRKEIHLFVAREVLSPVRAVRLVLI